jgi:hypothetical protein
MRTRPGLKLLGLCALMTGVMAISTTGVAQGETGACWGYIEHVSSPLKCFGETIGGPLEARPVVSIENTAGMHPSAATLLFGKVNLEITCVWVSIIEGGTLSANGSILLGRLEFGGCFSRKSAEKGLELLPTCYPDDPIAGVGRIRTEKGTGLIVLHNGEPVVKLSPDSGTTLAVIKLQKECPVAEEIVVTGHLVLQDRPLSIALGDPENKTAKEQFEKHVLTHLIREFPGLHLMRAEGITLTIDGSANVSLEGQHNALQWAGNPA